ncbi:hypothetical protein KY330_02810 [Candidatus Woesearchaeota archaeon]|nr:hypothetical protein [Candidatus Woesearchaeota archaeon]
MKRGQAAVEFAMGLSVLFFVFIVFMIIVTMRSAEQSEENLQRTMQAFEELVRSEVSLADYVQDGYTRTFTIPKTLHGWEYDLNNNPEGEGTFVNVSVVGLQEFQYGFLLGSKVTGDLKKGDNILKKKDGVITLNQ